MKRTTVKVGASGTRTKFLVKQGNVSVPIYSGADGRFIVRWKEDGRWRNTVKASRENAEEEARAIARRLHNSNADLNDLTAEEASVLARARRMQITHAHLDLIEGMVNRRRVRVADAVDEYVQAMLTARNGRFGSYFVPVKNDLKRFVESVGVEDLMDLKTAHVDAWLEKRAKAGAGQIRLRNLWVTVRTFIRWAAKSKYIDEANMPLADAIFPVVRKSTVEIYTPEQWEKLLTVAAQKNKEALYSLVFCGFCGCRTEEIAPSVRAEKDGLRWEHVRWDEGVVVMPAEVSKVNERRIMPILPALKAWVKNGAPTSGRIVTEDPWNLLRVLKREYPKIVGEKWVPIKNGARHSYGSYRTADLKSAGQVALEMGNSERVIRSNYLYHVSPSEAKKWWGIRP